MKKPTRNGLTFSQSCLAGHPESIAHPDLFKSAFDADDRPERELGWTYNPSAPATEKDLNKFSRSMSAFLDEVEKEEQR